MAKTTDLVADLRVCRHGSCSACGHDCGTAECIDHVIEDAADKIEDLVGRCARYAEEIAVLRQTNEDLRGTVLRRDVQIKKMKEENNGTTDEEN